jgi:hypothetical protein
MSKRALAVLAFLGITLIAQCAFAQNWSDTQLRFWWGPSFAEPGVLNSAGTAPVNIGKDVISFTHADGYKWGENFFNVDFLKSDSSDPANNSTAGAHEVYIVYRHDLSLSKISHKKVAFAFVKDVEIETGADFNTKNTAFAPSKMMPVLGPAFDIKVPKGFWKVSLLWDKEWNNNGIVHKAVTFNSAVMVASAWEIPVKVGKAPFSFEGFGSLNSSKGLDGFGNGTRPELLLHPKVMYNVGSLFSEKHNVGLGVGYEYWRNKYGENAAITPNADQHLPFVEAAVHF